MYCTRLSGNTGRKNYAKSCVSAPSHNFVRLSLQLRHVSTIGKKLVKQQYLLHCANFGRLAVEICWRVWNTPANFSGFRVLAVLLHGTLVVGVTKLCGVEQRAPPIFGRAAFTLGIGPHSSYYLFCYRITFKDCLSMFLLLLISVF